MRNFGPVFVKTSSSGSVYSSIKVEYYPTIVGRPPWSLKNDNNNFDGEGLCSRSSFSWKLKMQSFFLLYSLLSKNC